MIDQKCRLCPRECKAERENGQMGFCGMTGKGIRAARAALHFWEEPCISGKGGSGAVFFAGCTLRCVYCQNREIAAGRMGEEISLSRLVDIFFELKEQGAENINLVTRAIMRTRSCPQSVWQKREDLTFRLFITAADMRKWKS